MKKRIMRKFKLTEISAVDRPAQAHAKSVIMKRVDDDEDDDGDIELFAKALVVDRVDHGATKEDFEDAITKRAAAAFPGLSSAQAFARFITTDPAGKMFFKAANMAERRVAQAAQDLDPPQKSFGPAGRLLNELAADLARSKSLTLAQSYNELITDPTRADLIRRVREEERKATAAVAEQRWPMRNAERSDRSRAWLGGRG